MLLDSVFTQKTAAQDGEKCVEQVEAAHRLESGKCLQLLWDSQNQCGAKVQDFIGDE